MKILQDLLKSIVFVILHIFVFWYLIELAVEILTNIIRNQSKQILDNYQSLLIEHVKYLIALDNDESMNQTVKKRIKE